MKLFSRKRAESWQSVCDEVDVAVRSTDHLTDLYRGTRLDGVAWMEEKREARTTALNVEEEELCNRVFEIPNLPYGLGSAATRGLKLPNIAGRKATEAKGGVLMKILN